MARTFDPKQIEVLNDTKKRQLVSASAGSGKTTVMIEKISNLLISKQAAPEDILVLTFTNAAANEMRQRLITNLNDYLKNLDDEIERASIYEILQKLEQASLNTIDGFCSNTIKKFFYKLNLSPNVTIITGLSYDYYIERALDMTLKKAEENDSLEISQLVDCFEKNTRNLDNLKNNLLKAFNFVMTQSDHEKFLEKSLNEYLGFFDSANFLNRYLCENYNDLSVKIMQNLSGLESYENFYKSAKTLSEYLLNFTEKNDLKSNCKLFNILPQIQRNVIKEEDKSDYAIVKSYIDKVYDIAKDFEFINYIDENELKNRAKFIINFIDLLKNFIDCYNELKLSHGFLDFVDLERYFKLLLKDDEIKAELQAQYKYIFVDEYQDINPMQDELINSLKNELSSIFYVGDVKQSIYGFRQSSPDLFLNIYGEYKSSDDGNVHDMNINYRTNPKILEFDNIVFSALMTKELTDIDYLNDAKFEPKRDDFPDDDCAVEIAFFNKDKVADEEVLEQYPYSVQKSSEIRQEITKNREAMFVAKKIKELVSSDFYDAKLKAMRRMEYKDISILSRAINGDEVKELIEILRANGIPINISNKMTLKESETLSLIIGILKVVAYIGSDVDFVSFLTSNICNFSFDEIFEISSTFKTGTFVEKLISFSENFDNDLKNKIDIALNTLNEIRLNIRCKNNLETIYYLLNHYHLKQYILKNKNGMAELVNLKSFLKTLTSKEIEMPLIEFILYLTTNLKSNTEYSQMDENNSVTIQTIHKSKGLEYPVVFIYNASKTFKPNFDREDLRFDKDLGIGMNYFDLDSRHYYTNIPRLAITLKNKLQTYKDELRLFYVATTRPQNKLIISGNVKFENLKNGKISDNNFLELLYQVFQNQIDIENENNTTKTCTIHFFDSDSNFEISASENANKSVNILPPKPFKYKNEALTRLSLKSNVTEITSIYNEEYNILPKNLETKENLNVVKDNFADTGTLYHKVLSKLDFLGAYSCVVPQNVDEKLIKKCHEIISKLSIGAKDIQKEAQFMMSVPYNSVYLDSDIDSKILIQGVVDLMIEFDDQIILIDYKYSNSSKEKLILKYKKQLELYKLAIEKAKKKKVSACYIYKIPTAELIKL